MSTSVSLVVFLALCLGLTFSGLIFDSLFQTHPFFVLSPSPHLPLWPFSLTLLTFCVPLTLCLSLPLSLYGFFLQFLLPGSFCQCPQYLCLLFSLCLWSLVILAAFSACFCLSLLSTIFCFSVYVPFSLFLNLSLHLSLSSLSLSHPHLHPAHTHLGISEASPPGTEVPPWVIAQYSTSPSQSPSWWSQRIAVEPSKTFHWQNPHLMVGRGGKVLKAHRMVPPPFPNPHPHPPLTCSLEDRVNDGDAPSARERLGLIHQGLPHRLVPPQDDNRPRPQVDNKDIPVFLPQLWGQSPGLTLWLKRRIATSPLDHTSQVAYPAGCSPIR